MKVNLFTRTLPAPNILMLRQRAEPTTGLGPGSSRPGSYLTQKEADRREREAYNLPIHVTAELVYENLFALSTDPFFRTVIDPKYRLDYTHY